MKKHQKLKLIFMVVDSKDLLNGELIILQLSLKLPYIPQNSLELPLTTTLLCTGLYLTPSNTI